MKNLKILEKRFTYPKDFSPEGFMADSIGTATFPSGAAKPKNVIILVWAKYNFYLKHPPCIRARGCYMTVRKTATPFFHTSFTPLMTFIRKSAGMATSWKSFIPTMSEMR